MAPDKTLLLAHKQRLTALWASILLHPLSCGNKHGEKIEKGQNQVKQCVINVLVPETNVDVKPVDFLFILKACGVPDVNLSHAAGAALICITISNLPKPL